MVRALVAGGIVAFSAMVAIAAMPTPVSPRQPAQPAAPGGGTNIPSAATTASLEGQVHDASGTTLVGAVVEAVHDASGWRALALTDGRGVFVLERVPVGDVRLVVRKGAREFEQRVRVVAGTTSLVVQEARERDDAVSHGQVVGMSAAPTGVAPSVMPSPGLAHPGTPPGRHAAYPAEVASRHARPAIGSGTETSMDAYARVEASGYRRVADAPLSTFSIDVDTASYSNGRRFLMEGDLPPADAVRVEEWVNYFPYAYPAPAAHEAFGVSTAVTTCPWNPRHRLLRVGVRGRPAPADEPPARNLVFLVDVSGSMMPRDRLPLVTQSLRMLVDELTERDRIALVVYAGNSGLVLPSTPGHQKARIHEALQRLEAGGSTNGAGGIQLAYRTARDGFIAGGVNRVVLATDGDFNVGVTSLGELTRLIEQERATGVFLSVLGVGRGNLKDATLEQLADRGNGHYAYIDSLQEARRVLIEQVGATLITIARDVKLQVEFNPRHVAAYRLIGYENRALSTDDFADDRKDAGEIGAEHTVTALYEIVPPGTETDLPDAAPLRYQAGASARRAHEDELATVSVRHKRPDGDRSVLQAFPVRASPAAADADTAFASAVAEAALVLRKDPLATTVSLEAAVARARAALGPDPGGWRAEFVRLMGLAASLQALGRERTSEP